MELQERRRRRICESTTATMKWTTTTTTLMTLLLLPLLQLSSEADGFYLNVRRRPTLVTRTTKDAKERNVDNEMNKMDVSSSSVFFHQTEMEKEKALKENGFTNTCQCACCYQVGEHTECVSPSFTIFDVFTCTTCNVDACKQRFPIACNEPTSEVNTVCIIRKGWLVRLVPLIFIVLSIILLIYGVCIKKYDGYHPPSSPQDLLFNRRRRNNAAVHTNPSRPDYQSVSTAASVNNTQ